MGLFTKNKKEVSLFASTENELLGTAKLDVISALEEDRLVLTRRIEELMREYARYSGNKKLARRSRPVGRALNDWNGEDVK